MADRHLLNYVVEGSHLLYMYVRCVVATVSYATGSYAAVFLICHELEEFFFLNLVVNYFSTALWCVCRYRYTMKELHGMVMLVQQRAAYFKNWCNQVECILDGDLPVKPGQQVLSQLWVRSV